MSDGKKPERKLIPVEIINRYSSVFENSDTDSLSKTGYKEALVNSGFMDEPSVLLIRTMEATKQYNAHQHYEKYYEYKGRYEFPMEYAHPKWASIIERISDEMTIDDVCLIAFPIVGGLFDNMRGVLSRKIIERVIDKDKYPMLCKYPDGVIDDDDYRKKMSLHTKGIISLNEFRYACHAEDFKIIVPESKINKTKYFQRKTANFLAMWENLLFNKCSRSNLDRTTSDGNTTDQQPIQPQQPPPQPTTTDTPDGLPIPWLMKDNEREETGIAPMLKAAYMALRQILKNRNPTKEELWEYLTPENLPKFISKRDGDELTLTDSKDINDKWTEKKFNDAYRYWFKPVKRNNTE